MNKVFTKTKKIKLDEFWYLVPDSDRGLMLVFNEIRERVKKGTKEKEDFLYEEKRFYPRVAQALHRYIETTQNNSETLQEIISKTENLTNLVEKLDKEFKQF